MPYQEPKACHIKQFPTRAIICAGIALMPLIAFGQTNQLQLADIEVISVSASKRPLALDSVAGSLSIIDASEIERVRPQHINQLLSRTAGTWISRGNGQEHLTAIRSPVLTGAGGCGAFFMALDGISLRAPGFCNANQLFDANSEQAGRIEVLKGPASTLYGSNALHGVINIISPNAFQAPSNLRANTNQHGSLGLEFGAYDFTRISGDYQRQWDDQALRIVSNVSQENGFQSESGYDQQKATLIFERRGTVWDNKSVVDVANLNQETAGFIRGFEAYADEDIREINPNPEAFRDAKSLRAYSAFSRNLGDGRLSLKPYVRWNEMRFLQHFLPWQALEENKHSSAGLQTQYDISWLGADWVSGFDIDITQASLYETQAQAFSPSIPQGDHYNYDVDANLIAAYAQGTWSLDALSVIAGGRFERMEYDYNNLLSDGSACAPSVEVCRFSRPSSQRVSFSAFSPALSIEYQFSDSLLSYVKYSNGYRAPQATELFRLQDNQLVSDIDEVTSRAYELGFRFNTQTHSLHGAYYDMLKEDVIIRDTQRQYVAGGDTSHKGFELEYTWKINEHWRFAGNATWQKHVYEGDLAIANVSIEGNRIDTAPDTMYGARVLYTHSALSAELAWQYLSEYFLDPANEAEYEGHSLLDLRLHYQLSENLSFNADILNISDEDYAERADFAFGGYRYFVGQPRRLFVGAQYRF